MHAHVSIGNFFDTNLTIVELVQITLVRPRCRLQCFCSATMLSNSPAVNQNNWWNQLFVPCQLTLLKIQICKSADGRNFFVCRLPGLQIAESMLECQLWSDRINLSLWVSDAQALYYLSRLQKRHSHSQSYPHFHLRSNVYRSSSCYSGNELLYSFLIS